MRTSCREPQPWADLMLETARTLPLRSPALPTRFDCVMRENRGEVAALSRSALPPDGLERRNPVVVVLGDSVTAGHFESLLPRDSAVLAELLAGRAELPWGAVEVTDARECYPECFRARLLDRYERTSVSIVNAGIAGDHLRSMAARAERDVVAHDPDLVIVNGSLNWWPGLGTTTDFEEILTDLVARLRERTRADVVLLTPNGDVRNTMFDPDAPEPSTPERVDAIRRVAREQRVCLADVRAVWDAVAESGGAWSELLANGINHPGPVGHEVYAIVLERLLVGTVEVEETR